MTAVSAIPVPTTPPRRRSSASARVSAVVGWTCWAYFAALLALWLLLGLAGDCWWPTTLVLFGPRWVWALPLAALVPLAVGLSRRHLWVLLNASVVVVGPIMGFCVPWRRDLMDDAGAVAVRVLTCNGGGSNLRALDLITLVEQVRPDIVVLQECHELPGDRDSWRAWQIQRRGNVCLASRFPIRAVETLEGEALGGDGLVVRYELATPAGAIDFFGLHLETPREGLEAVIYGKWKGIPDLQANIALRRAESDAASRWVGQSRRPVLVAGDFNLPVDSVIYQQCWSWLTDTFSQAGSGFGYSKFTRWHGVRIDHILGGPGWCCRRCWVGPDVGSDHRPVIADMVPDRRVRSVERGHAADPPRS